MSATCCSSPIPGNDVNSSSAVPAVAVAGAGRAGAIGDALWPGGAFSERSTFALAVWTRAGSIVRNGFLSFGDAEGTRPLAPTCTTRGPASVPYRGAGLWPAAALALIEDARRREAPTAPAMSRCRYVTRYAVVGAHLTRSGSPHQHSGSLPRLRAVRVGAYQSTTAMLLNVAKAASNVRLLIHCRYPRHGLFTI